MTSPVQVNGSFFQAIALNDIPSQDNLTQINRLKSFGTTYLLNSSMAKNTNKFNGKSDPISFLGGSPWDSPLRARIKGQRQREEIAEAHGR